MRGPGAMLVAFCGCQSAEHAGDAGGVADTGLEGRCHGVGHYQAGKEGGYLPCCTGLSEVFLQVAAEQGVSHERVCIEPIGFRNYACIEGRCGDGRCEAPEGLACGCAQDCPSAVWQKTDAAASSELTADAGLAAPVPTLTSAMQDYLGWTRQGSGPQAISSEIFSLCRVPTPAEQAFVESQHGKGLFLLDWLNDTAVRATASGARGAFAVGAAIVKQKLMSNTSGELTVVALGLMIKREAGFAPQYADWEFGYWEVKTGLSSGATETASCGSCHAHAANDFVYLDQSWRL